MNIHDAIMNPEADVEGTIVVFDIAVSFDTIAAKMPVLPRKEVFEAARKAHTPALEGACHLNATAPKVFPAPF